jgi:hypothetical protein
MKTPAMNQGKYVFAQFASFLPQRIFDKCVEQYNGNYRIRSFSCWNQLLCMIFGQLSGRESLSDLVVSLHAHKSKSYHLGIGRSITKPNLAKANQRRDCRIFSDFAYYLIAEARQCCIRESDFEIDIKGSVYAFDSSIIDLCLNVFWWATFRKGKGAIKLHTLFDIKTCIPSFIYITEGLIHDVNILDELHYEKGSFYIMDRGYIDYERLYTIHLNKAYFVIRAKDNLRFTRMYSSPCNKSAGICCDQTVKMRICNSAKSYPEKLRRIKFYDAENRRYLVFLTNNLDLKAEEIALLYKYRWKIELFFKWIKQHLKVKSFWGTSENAVKTQVYIAIITYTLVAIIKSKLSIERSTYEILQILSVSLFDKTPINELLENQIYQDVKELNCNQLSLF